MTPLLGLDYATIPQETIDAMSIMVSIPFRPSS